MGLTNTLKSLVDLPVFEWMKQSPAASTSVSSMVYDGTRYGYYFISNAMYRYDVWTDTWQQVATCPSVPTVASYIVKAMYDPNRGYYGGVISCPSNTTLQIAGLSGNQLAGYTIEIISGTGAGQTRTILSEADPVVHDNGIMGIVNAGPPAYFSDGITSGAGYKCWQPNQWRNYQTRWTYGAGQIVMRRILYNNASSIYYYDQVLGTYDLWGGAVAPGGGPAANNTLYNIESSVITVDSPWTVNPDSTSQFVIKSGAVWVAAGSSGQPYYCWWYYDVLGDVWYMKGTQQSLVPASISGADIGLEVVIAQAGALETNTGTVSSLASPLNTRTLSDNGKAMAINQYANARIRITGGTGIGQYRTILANNATTFFTSRPWDTPPDNTSTYEVIGNIDKAYAIYGATSALLEYSVDSDALTAGRQIYEGVARTFSARKGTMTPIGGTAITYSTGAIATSTISAAGSGYRVGSLLALTSSGSAIARITGVDASGGVTAIDMLFPGSGNTASTVKATTVTPALGSGCTITVSTITDMGYFTSGVNHPFTKGDVVTIAGAVEAGYNGSKTITSSGYTSAGAASLVTFGYAVSGVAANATQSLTQTTSVICDAAANWVPDELIGLLIQTHAAGVGQVASMRRITDNTATTITVGAVLAGAATSGATKYVIFDPKALGTESTFKTNTSLQPWGFATGGTTGTIIDSSKNWPVNYWAGRKVRLHTGKNFDATNGAIYTVNSNTANTLTLATTMPAAPDATTCYEVLDNFGMATGGTATTLVDSTQNFMNTGTYSTLTNKRIKFLTGAMAGIEYTVTGASNATTLTYASGSVADANIAYAVLGVAPRSTGTCLVRVSGDGPANRQRKLISFRGGATPTVDMYDIAQNLWDIISQAPQTETLTTGTMYCYDNYNRIYFTKDATGKVYCLDVSTNKVIPIGTVPYAMSTAIMGDRIFTATTPELRAAGLTYLYLMRHSAADMWRILVFV